MLSSQTGKILKVLYYRNYRINYNKNLHNDRDHQVVIVACPNRAQQIQVGAILKKKPLDRHISATV